jgi:hypothetical protein
VIVGAGAEPVHVAVDNGFLAAVSLVGCAWKYLRNKGTSCDPTSAENDHSKTPERTSDIVTESGDEGREVPSGVLLVVFSRLTLPAACSVSRSTLPYSLCTPFFSNAASAAFRGALRSNEIGMSVVEGASTWALAQDRASCPPPWYTASSGGW